LQPRLLAPTAGPGSHVGQREVDRSWVLVDGGDARRDACLLAPAPQPLRHVARPTADVEDGGSRQQPRGDEEVEQAPPARQQRVDARELPVGVAQQRWVAVLLVHSLAQPSGTNLQHGSSASATTCTFGQAAGCSKALSTVSPGPKATAAIGPAGRASAASMRSMTKST